jgi:flagellar assembly factor FliW
VEPVESYPPVNPPNPFMLIQFADQIPPKSAPVSSGEKIHLPAGLEQLPGALLFELVCFEDLWPLFFLQPFGNPEAGAVVLEPSGWIADYQIELSDRALAELDIYCRQDALILNAVNIACLDPMDAVVDLVRPIVINRHNLVGKQLCVLNSDRYSRPYHLGVGCDAM